MRKFIIVLFLLFSVLTLGATKRIYSKETIQEVAGAIRNNGYGWQVIKNSEHTPIGITGVETRDSMIVLHHDVNANQVITFIVNPDETMARDGISVGVSGGLDFSHIYLYDRNGNRINPKKYCEKGSNIWIYGKLQ